MPGYAIIGEGECSKKFITDTLSAFADKAEIDGDQLWLYVPYDPQGNSDAIADIYDWVAENSIWTRAYSSGEENEDEQPAVDEFVVVKRGTPYQRIVKDAVADGAELLVILHTTDPDSPDDRDEEANDAIKAANQNEVPVRQLNNGMMEIDLLSEPEAAEESEDEGPDEDQVRQMGKDADKGDAEAAAALEDLGKEYGLDVAEDPYASMSWAEYAEAILATDAEKANEEVEPVEESKRPQKHSRDELEKMQVRQLRALAVAEGWGKPGQNFPAWFLIDHIAEGTTPSDDELSGETEVPKDRPSGAVKGRGAGRRGPAKAETNGGDTNWLLEAAVGLEKAAQAIRAHVSAQ